jgi:death on curing protein
LNLDPVFLSLENIISIHDRMTKEFGGMPGIADRGMLESAAAMPGAGISGKYLHEGLPAMAAAYLFHICKNHPFFDGNKRTAVVAAEIFLNINGMSLNASNDELKDLCLRVAAGEVSKGETVDFFDKQADKAGQG